MKSKCKRQNYNILKSEHSDYLHELRKKLRFSRITRKQTIEENINLAILS